jgi:signal transduction histidine kinase
MEGIVQTFLVIAREGRVPGEPDLVPLRDLIVHVLTEQQLVYPHTASQLQLSVPAEIQLLCVREVLHVILGNLLGNAWQHAPERPLWIEWLSTSPAGLCFHSGELRTTDQTPLSTRESRPSYGIGLSLVRRLCELQHWQLEADRSQGMRVTIWFPA